MAEIRHHRWRNQHGISFYQAEQRISEAVNTIYSMGKMSALASVINRRDLEQLVQSKVKVKRRLPLGLDEPDYICYIAYIVHTIAQVYKAYPDATRVEFVVAEKQKVSTHLPQFHTDIRNFLADFDPKLETLLGDLIAAPMQSCLPLQMADLLCWHLQRYYAKTFDRTDESRIWKLTKERDGHLHQWERADLEQLAKGLGLI